MEDESASREGLRKRGGGFTVAEGVGSADGSLDADLGGDGGHCQQGRIDAKAESLGAGRRSGQGMKRERGERTEIATTSVCVWIFRWKANKEFGCGVPADLIGQVRSAHVVRVDRLFAVRDAQQILHLTAMHWTLSYPFL